MESTRLADMTDGELLDLAREQLDRLGQMSDGEPRRHEAAALVKAAMAEHERRTLDRYVQVRAGQHAGAAP